VANNDQLEKEGNEAKVQVMSGMSAVLSLNILGLVRSRPVSEEPTEPEQVVTLGR
jgi:hypothetical protein